MREKWRAFVGDDVAKRIAAEIDRRGYGAIPDCLSEEDLQPLRTIARSSVCKSGGEYVHYTCLDAFAHTVLSELGESAVFRDLCRRLYQLATEETAPEVDFYFIFRCLQGLTGQRSSYRFHYDSYILTVLLPIVIPEEGPRGDFLIIPCTRPKRLSYFANLLDKMVICNKVSQILLRFAARRKRLGIISVRMQPGTMYFFWGYRSVHTNASCDPNALRATALFHYGDPHRNNSFRSLIRKMRRLQSSD